MSDWHVWHSRWMVVLLEHCRPYRRQLKREAAAVRTSLFDICCSFVRYSFAAPAPEKFVVIARKERGIQ